MKTVYLDNSTISKNQNESRIKKFKILSNFFLKARDGNEWQIDSSGYLVFINLHTGVKFLQYIDYFMTGIPKYMQGRRLNKAAVCQKLIGF